MAKRKSRRADYEIEDLDDIDLPKNLDEKITQMIAATDAELDATRVSFRWHLEPLSLIKEVAEAMGVPYQTYMKQVVYRQALDDFFKIQNHRKAGEPSAQQKKTDKKT